MAVTELQKELQTRRAWMVTIILALFGAFIFLSPYMGVILLAILAAYLSYPIFRWSLKKFKKSKTKAAAFTTTATVLIIAVPILIIVLLAVSQGLELIENLKIGEWLKGSDESIKADVNSLVESVNKAIDNVVGIKDAVSTEGIVGFLETSLPALVDAILSSIIGIATGIPNFIMNFIIFLFVFVSLQVNKDKILETIHYLSPFNGEVNNLYLKRIGLMASAMMKGQLLIAFLQGLATSVALAIIGFGEFFFFFLLLFTFMSLIPLGAGIVTIPLGIFLILIGDVWQGLLILGNHFLIVSTIDNIRPKLVPKEARLPAALTIISAFAGVAYFGVIGVIYGPIIMIVITTTIETYVSVKKEEEKSLKKKAA